MSICSGKHCAWCETCLESNEIVSCDSCRRQLVEHKLFDEVVRDF
jgi:hypothetical protein